MSSEPGGSRNKSSRLLAKFALGVVVLVLVVAGVVATLGAAANSRWERYLASLRAKGEPVTFEEIEALRTTYDDDENAALVIERLRPELEAIAEVARTNGIILIGGAKQRSSYFSGFDRDELDAARAFLAQYAGPEAQLATMAEMVGGRFPIDLAENPLDTLLPGLSPIRTAARLLQLRAMLLTASGQPDAAAEQVVRLLRIARTLNEEPTIVSRLVQIAVDGTAVETLEGILRSGELSVSVLDTVEGELERGIKTGTQVWGLRGERALHIKLGDLIVSGKFSTTWFNQAGGGRLTSVPSFVPTFIIRANQRKVADYMGLLIDAADDFPAQHAAAIRIDNELPTLGYKYFMVRVLMPSLTRSIVLNARCRAHLTCAQAGLAAERFRLDHARLPESLAELVPTYLAEVPTDPFDNQPLRFTTTEDGIVIYSIDEDLLDDGGSLELLENEKRPRDVGFRLLRPERRGVVILEPQPAEDNEQTP